MTEHPDVALPAAMVEAAARALAEVDPLTGDTFDDLSPLEQEHVCEAARYILAAALAVCDVRKEWGLRLRWLGDREADAPPVDSFTGTPDWASNAVCYHRQRLERDAGYQVRAALLHRLSITTPAEPVDTEGVGGDDDAQRPPGGGVE